MPSDFRPRANVIRQYPPSEFVGFWRLDRFAPGLRETLVAGDIVWLEERGPRAGEPTRRVVCEVEPRDSGHAATWVRVVERVNLPAFGTSHAD
jgi:hypothetical protein